MSRHNLPTFPTPFIGRTEDIRELSQLLDNPDCCLLTLVGPGGIGKTRLAVEVARCVQDDFPDGMFLALMQPLQDSSQVLSAVIEILPLQTTDDPEQDLLEYLREKHLLLILDNFEHVLNSAPLVSKILGTAPSVRIMATSRERLNLRGEWVHLVKGLRYPDDVIVRSDNYSAVELFTSCARRLRSDYDPNIEYEPVVRICQLVEGLPLALELAASWIPVLTTAQIATEIRQNLDFLASETRDLPERHRSMQAVFDHSWRLLTEEERIVMRRFAMFRGGCTREAAERVTGASLKVMATLVSRSMLWHDTGGERYAVQELVRQYAYDQLLIAGDAEMAEAAHCPYYAAFVEQRALDVKGRRQLDGLNEIEADWNNVRAAWAWALDHKDWDLIGQMMETLHLFCDMRARYIDGDMLFQQAVDALEPGDNETPHLLWGELLVRAAEVIQLPESHQWLRSQALLDRAEREAHIKDDPLYLWVRGHNLDIMRGEPNPDALPLLSDSLDGFRARDDAYYMARALRLMAYISNELSVQPNDEYASQFREYNPQYLTLTREIGDDSGHAHGLFYEAFSSFEAQQLDKAEYYFRESIAIASRMGDWKSVAVGKFWLGNVFGRRGDLEQAKPLLEEAIQLASEANYPDTQNGATDLLAAIVCIDGDYEKGLRLSANLPPTTTGLPLFAPFLAACGQGDFPLVREYLLSGLRWYIVNEQYVAHAVKVFPMAAMLLAHEGENEWAVELLARHASEHEIATGLVSQWLLLDETRNELERRLGTSAFDAAWQRGETLDVGRATYQLLAYLDTEAATKQEQANQALSEPLTPRELETLALVAQGRSNRQIAAELVISVGTVRRYVHDICQKLDAQNRTHAVARARELGLL